MSYWLMESSQVRVRSSKTVLNDNFQNANGTNFTEADLAAAFYAGQSVQARIRTIKLVLHTASSHRTMWEQRK